MFSKTCQFSMELPHGILHFPSHPFDVDVILAINDIRLEEKYTFTYWVILYYWILINTA